MPLERDRGSEIPEELRRALVDHGNFILRQMAHYAQAMNASEDRRSRDHANAQRAEAETISGKFESTFREWMR